MIIGKTMVLRTIEHRMFAYDSCAKNIEFVTAVQREFHLHDLTLGECTSYTKYPTESEICGTSRQSRTPENKERVREALVRRPTRSALSHSTEHQSLIRKMNAA